MKIHSTLYPYTSQRNAVYGTNGMVATSQPLAAQAGIRILQQGGNAVDAAIATAAALTVVEPTSNGIGGDAYALVWMKETLFGLNASGLSPAALNVEVLKEQGLTEMPTYGWTPVTVPGAPSAWAALNKRWGNLSLLECLTPAIEYAQNGYPVSPTLAKNWAKAVVKFSQLRAQEGGEVYQEWLNTFAPNGRAPALGEMWRSPNHANTLRLIGETNGDAFYKGELAEKIAESSRAAGGYLAASDLVEHQVEWVEPVHSNYRGYDICEIPPNGQGMIALMGLNILKQFEPAKHNDADQMHKQIEAMKLAFADGLHYITDINAMSVEPTELLSDEYSAKRAKLITDQAQQHCHGDPKASGTVYLATADHEGNMVSFIQSNYMGFGSGIVVPGTGIGLQNRGHTFSFDPEHANYLQPKKRTFHTIIPGFITYQGAAIGPFGVMGGFMQPQGHLQVAMNLIDFKLNPQAALDAPRWQWMKGNHVAVEPMMPSHIVQALMERGHDITVSPDCSSFGRGQAILREPGSAVLVGGTESRTDGAVIAY
ncbi:gamma-glutamyltransferase family protein [Vibrio porteresiae]|uniref:Gamma-glutamyltransferase family protein n=1 Tax=Vibrio porteresiae DSM 19223 TaxID=1123496 RepID=A0ABZ0Q8L9_9VIBR|nr:gamma-glutamyltransferase family protein [Vibrio porteresiae]WPC72779.1 gamma-glutamyltransferase family protein [Vibrio porteresiae DSM 19223]